MPHFHQFEPWFSVTRSPSRREHLELCEWWGNLPPRSCWPRSQAEVQKEHTELRSIADCSTFICMSFLHTKLFNMDHFISFEMFGNPYKQISLGQMVTRFWRMLKWLSICLFFNIWVSKHVNVFPHPGTMIQPPKVYNRSARTCASTPSWTSSFGATVSATPGSPQDDFRMVGCLQWLHLRCLVVCACACPGSATRMRMLRRRCLHWSNMCR